MESQSFDNLSRLMARGVSRRTVLRGMFSGSIAALGLGGAAAAKPNKVDICHYDAGSGMYHKINVSKNAESAHLAHGDNSDIGCADGATLNLDTCACEQTGPSHVCPAGSSFGEPCGNGGGCAWSSESDDVLYCIVFNDSCASCDAGCPDGTICVRDYACGGNGHCHPIAM